MEERGRFDFLAGSVAEAYESTLVPVLFDPWARRLVGDLSDLAGRRVLDLGSGTGIVTRLLPERVGPRGRVIASDVSPEMLEQARARCSGSVPAVEFVVSPAEPLALPDASVDVVLCQQAFQFFPDKAAAATEIYRVLAAGGRVAVSTWRGLSECDFFRVLCDALVGIGEDEIADAMRTPFEFMPASELASHFESAGFPEVRMATETLPLTLTGGLPQAIRVAWATPIGPQLEALSEGGKHRFREAFARAVEALSSDGVEVGRMSANVLSAVKPA